MCPSVSQEFMHLLLERLHVPLGFVTMIRMVVSANGSSHKNKEKWMDMTDKFDEKDAKFLGIQNWQILAKFKTT